MDRPQFVMQMKNIGIIGVGGVGGFFGGKLCRLQEVDPTIRVSFVARGLHLSAIQASGLLLNTEADGELACRPSLATDDFRRLPPLDLCLVCVKVFDLPAALLELRQVIGDNTVLLPLLNGVDIYPRVRAQIERGIVLQACVYVGTHIDRPGHVAQAGGACKILFGPDPQRPDFDPREVIQLFDQAGIQSEWTTHIQTEIWQKYIFICSFGLVSAASGNSLGEIRTSDRLAKDVETVMEEVLSLAKAIGVLLPADITASSLQKAARISLRGANVVSAGF